MKKKRLLTLEDLYNYYSSNSKSSHFSAKDNNDNIVVQVNGNINFSDDKRNIEGFLPVILHACHTEKNINGSYISKETMENALPSFYNRPILGYIHKVDGVDEFYDHRMHEGENEEIVYDEIPIGVIPESGDVHLEYNEEMDNYQVVVNGYIFEEYTKAADILRREEQCSVSVELSIRELQYNAKDKFLDIQDFFFSGVTILGKTPEGEEVKPGMKKSDIKLADFKQKNNAKFSNEEIVKKLEELTEKVNALSIENSKEGGMSSVENEKVVLENLEEDTIEEVSNENTEENVEINESVESVENESESESTDELDEEVSEEESVEEETSPEEEKFQKTFSISHEDIKYGLYQLLAAYEETDNDWYFIEQVFDDYFIYSGAFSGDTYGQKYKVENDNVSFEYERYSLHAEYLTDSELAKLNEMRSNYDALLQYQTDAENKKIRDEKLSILSEYTNISNTEEYNKLLEDIDNYTAEELEEKANAIVGKYVKQGRQFSASVNNEPKKLSIPVVVEKKEPAYGGLFD